VTSGDQPAVDASKDNAAFEALLQYVKHARGFDFTGYKRSSLYRRITKRMQTVGIADFEDYVDYLEVHPDEFAQLFDTILINVTTFFRDRDTWDYLTSHVLPAIIAAKGPAEPIRVWSAACASGEEPYSLAMALCELLRPERFREQVKIYATDVDEDALTHARQAIYTHRSVSDVPPELLEKYFEQSNSRYTFRKDVRRTIIFGRHDLMQDAPISHIDLLLCRNALMYFNAESQARILKRFHFSLNESGFMVVGKAEMLFSHSNLFTPNDLRRRVFKKLAHTGPRSHLSNTSLLANVDGERLAKHIRLRDSAFELGSEPQIVIDINGHIALINQRARDLFSLGAKDLNRPMRELDIYNRFSELKTRIQATYAEMRPDTIKEIHWVLDTGEVRILDLYITPVRDGPSGSLQGISLTFNDLTATKRLQEKLESANQELETAYEELQSTNEELETTNEELQSTIEEFETTNEELQSTNEELETINEELQSTNEEMQAINAELRARTAETNRIVGFLESIIASLRGGVVVVDADFRVLIWSKATENLWGLRSDEVLDKNFLNLDIGLPVEKLRGKMRQCLAGDLNQDVMVMEAVNRRGKQIHCRVSYAPLLSYLDAKVEGVILIMEELPSELTP
jgi:two-component system, chemotaxis family, CheB/CheR fusion protein